MHRDRDQRASHTEPPEGPSAKKLIPCDQNADGVTVWIAWVMPGPDTDDVVDQHCSSPTFHLFGDAGIAGLDARSEGEAAQIRMQLPGATPAAEAMSNQFDLMNQ